jgi:ABC-type nitrate/sulfonate/bicarbonate transport system substrate-binding protein
VTNRTLIVAHLLMTLVAVACAAPLPSEQTPAPAGTASALPLKTGTMHLDMPDDADVVDVPWLVAVDSLKEQGYTIREMSFASTELGATAMAQGALDIGSFSNQVAWAAIGKGAPIVTVVDKCANEHMVITRKDIETCAQLEGKAVAVPGVSTVSGTMVAAHVEDHCPEARPQILIISGGSNRRAALLTGAVDAAVQDIDDQIKLEREQPGQFHALVVFAKEFPGLHIQSYAARRGFAEENPEMLKDVIRALLTARRQLQDPEALREAIIHYLDMDHDKAEEAANQYLAREIWDVGGSYSRETVQDTLSFLQQQGTIPLELTAEDIADLSYYSAVLDEIGRQ